MKKRLILSSVLISLMLGLLACDTFTTTNSSLLVLNMQGETIAEITNVKILQDIEKNWSQRIKIQVKKKPDFEVKLVFMKNDQITVTSLYSHYGFATQLHKHDTNVYRVQLPNVDLLLNTQD